MPVPISHHKMKLSEDVTNGGAAAHHQDETQIMSANTSQ